jgi:site-specific DNA recombinase
MSNSQQPTERFAVYARVSSEEQREGQSIDSQISELETFANGKGWRVGNVYKDNGWSIKTMVGAEA